MMRKLIVCFTVLLMLTLVTLSTAAVLQAGPSGQPPQKLRVGLIGAAPFVIQNGERYSGF